MMKSAVFRRVELRSLFGRFLRARSSVVLFGVSIAAPASAKSIGYVAGHEIPIARLQVKVADSVVVTNAWARPALKGGTGGVYLTISNKGGRAIHVVSASCNCAETTELHVSSVQNGMAHMEMLPKLVVTPGASVSLKPGGMHFMLLGLRKAFVTGDSVRLVLRLANETQVAFNVAIRTQ